MLLQTSRSTSFATLTYPSLSEHLSARSPLRDVTSIQAGAFVAGSTTRACQLFQFLLLAPIGARFLCSLHALKKGKLRCSHWGTKGSRTQGDQRLNKKSKDALQAWGGGAIQYKTQLGESVAVRSESLPQPDGGQKAKWTPKREAWLAYVTDDNDFFGPLSPGHEVEVVVEKSRLPHMQSSRVWIQGCVIAVDAPRNRAAVCLHSKRGTVEIRTGVGLMRRPEDAREMCTEQQLREITLFRSRGNADGLFQYASTAGSPPVISHSLIMLCRMGNVEFARQIYTDLKSKVTSVAVRELAHTFAKNALLHEAITCLDRLQEPMAAQLLVESVALALTWQIQAEKSRTGVEFLRGVETNEAVMQTVKEVQVALSRLGEYAQVVRDQDPRVSRQGLTEAFNELLQSCGRAHSAPVAFQALDWMEALAVPKDAFTYEAIGVNVVKRVSLLRKVWDLPNLPEEGPPEVVFAGRSNVGKSSLVNMLLSRLALAPTSQRPGKTKTMDFFDVNSGHPALPRFRLVDVPGLGFARVSKDLRQRWVGLIGGYLVQRRSLKLVYHLLDASFCEIMPADREMWRLLAQAKRTDYEFCIILTKADTSLPSQIERFANKIREALLQEGSELAMNASIFACSSRSKLGKDTLWRKIWTAIGGDHTEDYGPRDPLRWRHQEFAPHASEAIDATIDSIDTAQPSGRRRIMELLS